MVTLGEFLDDLEIGKQIKEMFSITENERSTTDEKLGEERLGHTSIMARLGPTLILLTSIFIFLVLIVLLLVKCRKRCNLSQKCERCVRWL